MRWRKQEFFWRGVTQWRSWRDWCKQPAALREYRPRFWETLGNLWTCLTRRRIFFEHQLCLESSSIGLLLCHPNECFLPLMTPLCPAPTVFHPTLENGKKAGRIQNLEELHFGFYFLARWLPLGFLGPYPPGFLFPYHWTCIELFNEHKLCARPTVTPVISVTTFNPHAHPLRWILLTSFYRWSDIYKC